MDQPSAAPPPALATAPLSAWAAGAVSEILIEADALQQRVHELGQAITEAYAGRDRPLVLVGVLKGVAYFMADLSRAIHLPLSLDFMTITRYGPHTRGSGQVRLLQDLAEPIAGCDVLLVEDVIDTGLPQGYLLRLLRARDPASLAVCTLLDRESVRLIDIPLAHVGFQIPDRFVIGYGLDYQDLGRNLPYIAVLQPPDGPGTAYWS
jgi:hypoxanthine phosphoribosyltransferase